MHLAAPFRSLAAALLLLIATLACAGPSSTAGSPVVGAWAAGFADTSLDRLVSGRRQYVFSDDGTYTYRSEVYDGLKRWILIREEGSYAVSGEQLTVSPTEATLTVRDRERVVETRSVPLEEVTYAFQLHYFSGIDEWNLVLTPPAKTRRDGMFASNDQFPRSYLLSPNYEPEWSWP